MKKLIFLLFMFLGSSVFSQYSDSELKSILSSNGTSLVFFHEDYMYIYNLGPYNMYDVYTGDIKFKKRPNNPKKEWEHFFMINKTGWIKIKTKDK